MKDLQEDHTVQFHFFEGDIESVPGPGIKDYFDGPFYSYYQFPRSFDENDESMLEAYQILDEVIEEEGPFDGVLGFSHGGTLASGYLIHYAKTKPNTPPPFRCAIFLNSLPPFRMNPGEEPVVDDDLKGYINVPTVNVAGLADFAYKYSIELHQLCPAKQAALVVHDGAHDVPRDSKNVATISMAIRKLAVDALHLW